MAQRKPTSSTCSAPDVPARLSRLAGNIATAAAGASLDRFVQSESDSSSSSETPSWRLGWVAGVGAETRLWGTNWRARVEYLHYDFGNSGSSFDFHFSVTSRPPDDPDVVRAGVSYKFDRDGADAGPATIAMPVKARPAMGTAWNWNGYYTSAAMPATDGAAIP